VKIQQSFSHVLLFWYDLLILKFIHVFENKVKSHRNHSNHRLQKAKSKLIRDSSDVQDGHGLELVLGKLMLDHVVVFRKGLAGDEDQDKDHVNHCDITKEYGTISQEHQVESSVSAAYSLEFRIIYSREKLKPVKSTLLAHKCIPVLDSLVQVHFPLNFVQHHIIITNVKVAASSSSRSPCPGIIHNIFGLFDTSICTDKLMFFLSFS
jgi:hypothetical protein